MEDLSEFDKRFVKNCNEKSKEGYFLEADIQYPKNLHNVQIDLPILPERMNIKKIEKLVANIHDENKYGIHKNVKKHRDIKLITTQKKKLFSVRTKLSFINQISSFIRNKIFCKGFRKTSLQEIIQNVLLDDIESVAIKQTMNKISMKN